MPDIFIMFWGWFLRPRQNCKVMFHSMKRVMTHVKYLDQVLNYSMYMVLTWWCYDIELLSYNCRYLDDICTINLQDFGDIAKDIDDNTLLLEGSTCSYKQDTFLDLYIRVVDHKFITVIYHKVNYFNFEVKSYPFPQSNVHSMLGYSTYYSQLIRFFRLCNNINDFLFRAKFSYSKLVKRGYKHNLLLKYFKIFCSAYNIEGKYGQRYSDLLFSRMLKHNPFVSCNINNIKEINDIVKASYVKLCHLQGIIN